MKFSIKFLLKFYDEFFCACVCPSVPGWGSGYRILIRGLTYRKNIHSLFSFGRCLRLEGKYRYRGPAGRLDTLHVLSEREIFIKKTIEGPSSYSYI